MSGWDRGGGRKRVDTDVELGGVCGGLAVDVQRGWRGSGGSEQMLLHLKNEKTITDKRYNRKSLDTVKVLGPRQGQFGCVPLHLGTFSRVHDLPRQQEGPLMVELQVGKSEVSRQPQVHGQIWPPPLLALSDSCALRRLLTGLCR